MKKYNILALCGEAGSGKDYILNRILTNDNDIKPHYHKIVNCTTRPKRQGEEEGKSYYFLSPADFATKVLNCEMIEATSFRDWFYGTTVEALSNERINIGVFSPEAIDILQNDSRFNVIVVHIKASARTRLIRQLEREQEPDIEEIIRRYKADLEDFDALNFSIEFINESHDDADDIVLRLISTKFLTSLFS